MSYLSLYRKWRPVSFSDVLGQDHVTETLVGALTEDRVAHAYLFSGPRGTGKTSSARILAKALNCTEGPGPQPCGKCQRCTEIAEGSSLDVFEMDAASHTSVDDVREIRERIPFASAGGGHKIYIIDEAHQLSTPAFNALLKMLEEPPAHVVFVLCTTEAHKLPATVVSRCQRFEFRRIPADAVAEHLGRIAAEEKIEADPDALALIARHARGSVRDALSLLDQAAGTTGGHVSRDVIRGILGDAPEDVLLELAEAVGSGDMAEVFRRIEALSEQGWDPRQLLRQLLEQFRALFLASRDVADLVETDDEHRTRLTAAAEGFSPTQLGWILRVLGDAQADMRLSTHPRLTLEVGLARAATLEAGGEETVIARLERLERALVEGGATAERPAPAKRSAQAERSTQPERSSTPEPQRRSADEDPKEPETPRPVAQEPASVEEPAEAGEPATTPDETAGEPARTGAGEADLQEGWEAFLELVRTRKKTTYALIKEGWPISLEDGTLLVGFENSFHAESIHKAIHTKPLTEAAGEAFGGPVTFRSEVRAGEHPARRSSVAAAEATKEDEDPVDLVVRGLGAEVVDEVND